MRVNSQKPRHSIWYFSCANTCKVLPPVLDLPLSKGTPSGGYSGFRLLFQIILEKGGEAMVNYEALIVVIAFGMLIIALLNARK